MKKTLIRNLSAFALLVGMALNASALSITPASSTFATGASYSGNQNSQNVINGVLNTLIGTSSYIYKQNVGGGESGSLAGSYKTTFSNPANDPSDALIKYTGGNIVGPTAYLLVKDGNHSPWWYLFNLTSLGWNGTDDLVLSGFWPNGGAISHVALYGPCTTVKTPDGGSSLILLGAALSAIGLVRRKLIS